jgi:hypothetical protein
MAVMDEAIISAAAMTSSPKMSPPLFKPFVRRQHRRCRDRSGAHELNKQHGAGAGARQTG